MTNKCEECTNNHGTSSLHGVKRGFRVGHYAHIAMKEWSVKEVYENYLDSIAYFCIPLIFIMRYQFRPFCFP
ncbi:hypothetical protein [Candidatus Sarmatiella mevalonica]|uniref:hypothetical protein n=1 Tax=Candidatus Sarmatiella mevalonica TaxID=2770581 RepID=UPI0019243B21|nr:hypothetical protein [Candidatus Sarmatiella mevalonica]